MTRKEEGYRRHSVTVMLSDAQIARLDRIVEARGLKTRSSALDWLIRRHRLPRPR